MDEFKSRRQAGRRLSEEIFKKFPDVLPSAVVISVPRGGVVIGDEVSRRLRLPHDIVVPRKIGSETDREWAIGAVTEDGQAIFDEVLLKRERPEYVESEIAAQTTESRRRLGLFRGHRAKRDLQGKTVILVDDGIARGWTLAAAIKTLRKEGAAKIIAAVPVASKDGWSMVRSAVDDGLVLLIPDNEDFVSVGAHYAGSSFAPISSERVCAILNDGKNNKSSQ